MNDSKSLNPPVPGSEPVPANAETPAVATPKSTPSAIKRRMQFFNDPTTKRIWGIDLARALAILGMVYAHVGGAPYFNLTEPGTWPGIVNGFSAALFAVLAGVSIAIITGGVNIPDPSRMPNLRLKLFTRGALIFVIGMALEVLNTPIVVILTIWGLLYAAIIPFLRLSRGALAIWAAVFGILGPIIVTVINVAFLNPSGTGLISTINHTYPAHIWLSLMLVGLIIGRSDLSLSKIKGIITGIGAAMVAVSVGVSFGLTALAGSSIGDLWYSPDDSITGMGDGDMGTTGWDQPNYIRGSEVDPNMICESFGDGYTSCFSEEEAELMGITVQEDGTIVNEWASPTDPAEFNPSAKGSEWDDASSQFGSGWSSYFDNLFSSEPWNYFSFLLAPDPHSGSPIEWWNSVGVSCLVIGLCLFIAHPLRWVFLPLLAMGSMPLTMYVLHVVSVFAIAGPQGMISSALIFWISALVFAVIAVLIWLFAKRGPFEAILNHGTKVAAGEVVQG